MTGPKPRAKTYSATGSRATVLLTLNSSMSWLRPGLRIEVPAELGIVSFHCCFVVLKSSHLEVGGLLTP